MKSQSTVFGRPSTCRSALRGPRAVRAKTRRRNRDCTNNSVEPAPTVPLLF